MKRFVLTVVMLAMCAGTASAGDTFDLSDVIAQKFHSDRMQLRSRVEGACAQLLDDGSKLSCRVDTQELDMLIGMIEENELKDAPRVAHVDAVVVTTNWLMMMAQRYGSQFTNGLLVSK